MNHSRELNSIRIDDTSLAHSIANAIHTERSNDVLHGSKGPNAWVDSVGLTAGVVELIGEPAALKDFTRQHLDDGSQEDPREQNETDSFSKAAGSEAMGRIAAALATIPGEKSQVAISNETGVSKPVVSKAIKKLVEGGYVDDENGMVSSSGRPVKYLTPTKKFARELAENPSWQRAVLVRKIAKERGMDEGDVLTYALRQVLEEEAHREQL